MQHVDDICKSELNPSAVHYLTFAMSKRRSAGGCSRPYFGSIVMSSTPTATTFFIFVLYIVLVLVEELIGSRLPNLRIYLISHLEVDIKAVLSPLGFRTISFHDEG